MIGTEFDLATVEAAGGPSGDRAARCPGRGDPDRGAPGGRRRGGSVPLRPRARPLRAARGDLHQPPGAHALERRRGHRGSRVGSAPTPTSTPSPTTTAKGRWPATPRRRSTSPGGPRPRRPPSWPSRPRPVTSTAPSACWSCSTDLRLELRCDLLLDLATALRNAGDPRRRATVFAAAEVARTLGDPQRLARAALILAPFGMTSRSGLSTRRPSPSTRRPWPACPTSRRRCEPGSCRRSPPSCSGEGTSDRRRRARVRGCWRWPGPPGTGPPSAPSLATAWATLDGRDRFAEAWVRMQQEALAAAEREDDPEALLLAQLRLIGPLASVGEVAAARSHLEEAERLADGLRLPRVRWRILNLRAMLAAPGRGPRAGRAPHDGGHRGRSVLRPVRVVITATAGALLFAIRNDQGRIGEMIPAMEELVRTQPGAPVWRVALASALLRCGRAGGGPGALRLAGRRRLRPRAERHQLPRDPLRPRSTVPPRSGPTRDGGGDLRPAAAPCRHLQLGAQPSWPSPTTWGWPARPGRRASTTSPSTTSPPASSCASELGPDRTWRGPTTTGPTPWPRGRVIEAKEHAEAVRAIAEEIGMLGPDGPMPLVRKLLDG